MTRKQGPSTNQPARQSGKRAPRGAAADTKGARASRPKAAAGNDSKPRQRRAKPEAKPATKRAGTQRASKAAGGKSPAPAKQHRGVSRWARALRVLLKLSVVGMVILSLYLIYLNATIQAHFEGKRWAVPAKVYAKPLELFEGAPLSRDRLLFELERLGYRMQEKPEVSGPGHAWQQGRSVHFHTRGFQFWDAKEPPRRVEAHFDAAQLTQLTVQGERDSLIRLEPVQIGGFYPAHNEDRVLITLAQAPPLLVQALLAVEDRHFYEHWGISLRGIARALWVNLQSGQLQQGGSTLTQQLVKNFYLSSERTLSRKVQEALMAILLDWRYPKDAILEAYLNEIYLGQAGRRAIHGFGLASLYYFGQPLRELQAHQIALLVGIVKGASWYDPRRHPERARERRNQVLQSMGEQGVLSQAQVGAAQARPLEVAPRPRYSDARYPAFLDLVKRRLQQDYREEDLRSEGLRIFTTLDPYIQEQWEAGFDARFAAMEQRAAAAHKEVLQTLQGAAVITDVNTGEVAALLGDRNPRFQGFNRALDAYRPVGSLLKPVVVLTALEQGYTLGSLVDDSPFSARLPHGQLWEPRNFDNDSHGKLPLQMALSYSYNQAFARLIWDVGTPPLVDNLRRLGIDKAFDEVPAIALGAIDLSPFEVATLYQTLASAGFYTPLRAIRSVLDGTGEPLQRYPFATEQRIPAELAYLVNSALQDAVRNGTGRSAYHQLPDTLQLAGKTGTSDDQRDVWFAGWSGNYLGVVWLGHDDNKPTPLTGASAALPVWLAGMKQVDLQPLVLPKPAGVEWVWLDAEHMALASPQCENAVYLPLLVSTIPTQKSACGKSDEGGVRGWFRKWFGR